MVDVSVVVCTHNPRRDYLTRVLRALDEQSLPKERWELLLVDSGSGTPVADDFDLASHPRGRHVRVEAPGLMAARLRGIAESTGELLVFVDDDNILAPDYLEQAQALQERHDYLGVFGSGSLDPEFEVDPPGYLRPNLRMLSLRSVPAPLWSNNPEDYLSMPWGAGLCVRRSVADLFVELVDRLDITTLLGRNGQQLYSGDDDLFSWASASARRGFGVFPSLQVTHLIPASRLGTAYMLTLLHDHRFSRAIRLFRMVGTAPRPLAWHHFTHLFMHGVRKGPFAVRCRWAEMRGEAKAAQFIRRERLRPIGVEIAPPRQEPLLGEEPR